MFNPFVGILKFILSLLVVAIHVEPFTGDLAFYTNNCVARIAVPTFFTLSSYFLFDKLLNKNWDKKIFMKQLVHLGKYYLLWLLLHAPVVISRLADTTDNPLEFIWLLFQAICLKGPYGSLWFLPATIMAFILVYYLGKKTNPYICLLLSFPFFFFAVLETEYYALIKDIMWMDYVYDFFVLIFGWLANGLTFGFFFCSLGFYIAYTKNKKRAFKIDVLATVVSFILLFIETTIIRDYHLGASYGAMILLIPTVYYLTRVVLNMRTTEQLIPAAKYLQNMSMLIYPMHFAVMEILDYFLLKNKTYASSTALQYVIVTAVTCIISIFIQYLGEKKNLKLAKAFYGKA